MTCYSGGCPMSECSFYTHLQDSQTPQRPSCTAAQFCSSVYTKMGKPSFRASNKQSKNYHNQDVLIRRSKIKGEKTFLWGNVTVRCVSTNGHSRCGCWAHTPQGSRRQENQHMDSNCIATWKVAQAPGQATASPPLPHPLCPAETTNPTTNSENSS